jgi:YbgC/YbaW family acyl-CoA thioester hydrolase
VRHYEVDEYAHVNHANYVHYLETGRIDALESVGLPLREMRREGYLLVAVDLAVRYHAPARAGDTLEITTRVVEIRPVRNLWTQEIRDVKTDRLLVTAEVTGAFMTENGRPTRAPERFEEKLRKLEQADPAFRHRRSLTRPPS